MVSLAIWDHTVLPDTSTLTPAKQAGTQFPTPEGSKAELTSKRIRTLDLQVITVSKQLHVLYIVHMEPARLSCCCYVGSSVLKRFCVKV